MNKNNKIPELIEIISQVLERSCGTLSDDEVQGLQKTIKVLRELEEAEPDEVKLKLETVAVMLLRFFAKPEII